jgi:geranylgeranyl pyrophosphate synthase
MLTLVDPLASSTDRVLDGPTSLVWIHPWLDWITSHGAEYRTRTTVTGLRCDGHRITGVEVSHGGRIEVITGDYYVCALPVERVAPLLTPAVLEADPSLASIEPLARNVEWMSGLQFYLRRPMPLVHGHVIHIDTEWALTSISQLQFWRGQSLERYTGHPEVRDILSVDVSDWEEPGMNGRQAMACDRLEVALEVWAQLKRSINDSGAGELQDKDLSAWFMDPDIRPTPERGAWLMNVEPLLVNLADSWRLRPESVTAIPNFFLASDYVRTFTDLATMEAANEAARRAVNGVLDATGYSGERCGLWPLEEPALLTPLREYDTARFKLGLPWDGSLLEAAVSGVDGADPVLHEMTSLLAGAEPIVPSIEDAKLRLDDAERSAGLGQLEETATAPLNELRELGQPVLSTTVPIGASLVPSSPPVGREEPSGELDHHGVSADYAASAGGARAPIDSGPSIFLERLDWYRDLIAGLLESSLPNREPRKYLYTPMREFVERPAKGLRPGLLLAACRSHGGSFDEALASAAGLELLHHAFLVHDDIEDGSLIRRGRTTVHRQLGDSVAINVGDALNAYAMRMFRRNVDHFRPEVSLAILDEVDHLLVESLEGQAIELGWVKSNSVDIGVDDYLRMVLKKTAWYSFIHPMRIGALIAGITDDLDRFNRLGFLLGAAFQIHDDVLNLTGAASRYGKEIGGDLWEGKRTIVLSHAIRHAGPAERDQLARFLDRGRNERLPREVAAMYDVLARTGAIEWAHAAAMQLVGAAREELPLAFRDANEGPDLDFVRSLTSYLVDRDL